MSTLFSPLSLGPLSLDNRIVIAPMCQYSCDDDNGQANAWHAMHLGHLAQSGAGLLILEATAVEARGRISWADLGLWDDATEQALRPVLEGIRRWSPIRLGIQLAHAGRKGSTHKPWEHDGAAIAPDAPHGWQTVSSTDRPYEEGDPAPQRLDEAGIEAIVQAFVDSAQRAHRLGFDLIELHGAHGYLLHQFLSPLSNDRTDAYGGSLENRLRLPLQVFDAVRAAVPDSMAVGMRISASDWVEGGWDVAQSIALAQALEARGCSYLHVSSGGLDPRQQIPVEPGYQVPFARDIKAALSTMPVVAVGLITEPAHAERIVAEGKADAVAIARAALYDPRWPWHAAVALGATLPIASQYLRSEPREARGVFKPR
ncbi:MULTISPECIES: NADH:flavin oxidoreductase/NADH oxidase [Pseudoxanthomonas]|uniref:2,4-dienoyl-CoA reductase-like NADH-dependent reductase (Old Yellow Enzyme family) n=1 Tax=Pseudoxanthomonas winnipegensis TaxID=2480810 RepID=A0AAW8GGW7_9GAMM|nr:MULTISPECIES: NADH:flavin oxidoreductase/NADH oxidase [Pseudoxanthomonas]MDQ1120997.1 2,4-dienoyl-CoA reductase-like NADH-dependent reductase (Old Yellow Enzyme family) [Pseudoxanthomonas winnipegensis]MDQ1134227.1 2,4-dienoyl-CoA reductase-like NADH-dependent reductase (Old Yellow Enzyme family) [Pseudoxanthomonas winnipegensis]MDR6139539.1 2,4-dienoyl-CoA reductase-like NADH-dependent reductase (Old Yellow Enzyme family) [Pseudoxanthomonas sp. SORGH_AS_0997]